MKDFKSLTYCKNNFDKLSLQKMRPILDKKLPYHLDELRLMNLGITGKISFELVKEIQVKN
jgi:hypothetical protein